MRRFAALALLAFACHGSPTEPEVTAVVTTLAGRAYVFETGTALSRARVVVSGNSAAVETRTDDAGLFRFDGLSPGSYSVAVSAADRKAGVAVPMNVQPGANWLEVPVSSSGCVIYSGFVRDAKSGRPIAGVNVHLMNDATTNALGWYALVVGCPPHFIGSSVQVTFDHPDYKPCYLVLIMASRYSTGLRDVLMEPR